MRAQNLSATSGIRKLCFDIENQVNAVLANWDCKMQKEQGHLQGRNTVDSVRKEYERGMEELKSNIVNSISSQLPHIIEFQQELRNKLEDSQEQRQQWRQKYKKIFNIHQSNQLQNDKLKIQIITLSQNYQSLSFSYEQFKFKYHEMKQEYEGRLTEERNCVLAEKMGELRRVVSSNSDSEREGIRNQNQVLVEERELFLEEIKRSQQDIVNFKGQVQQLIGEKLRIEKENLEVGRLLEGEQARCEKLDREMIGLINQNQELKVQILEQQQLGEKMQEQMQKMRMEEQKVEELMQLQKEEKEHLNQLIIDLRQQLVQAKGQCSQHREKYNQLEEQGRAMKNRQNECNKQNQQLRAEIQKLLSRLEETTQSLEEKRQEERRNLTEQLEKERTRQVQKQQESNKKSQDKVQEISQMHKQITSKLQQKIVLLQKSVKEKKDKISQLKFQVERLYQSLQIQVQKQFKTNQQLKELTQAKDQLSKDKKELQQKIQQIQQKYEGREQNTSMMKLQLRQQQKKLKRIGDLHAKLIKIVLPNLREELHNTRLACTHFCKMLDMEKQQTSFLLQTKHQNFSRLLAQTILQQQLAMDQAGLTHNQELLKWKETSKNYEDKYSQLKEHEEYLSQKNKQLEGEVREKEREVREREERRRKQVEELEDKLDRQHLEQLGTLKTVDRLKDKCREVEQYYKLVEQLEKQNYKLKENINHLELYSFKGEPMEHTKQRQQFTGRHSPTHNHNRTHAHNPNHTYNTTHNHTHNNPNPNHNSQTSLTNYITKPNHTYSNNTLQAINIKSDHQKQRLMAVKKQYQQLHHDQY